MDTRTRYNQLSAGSKVLAVAGVALGLWACNGGSSTTLPPGPPAAGGSMYITDFANNAIVGWNQGANCNCSPTTTIRGANTGLSGPQGIAIDAGSNIYVANQAVNTMTKYPGGNSGNVTPSLTIGGLANPIGVAVDTSNNVYLTNSASSGVGTMSIQVYPPGSRVPSSTIAGPATGLSTPGYIALDATGNIWVANQTGNSIEEFPKTANGNVPPAATIAGVNTLLADPQGIAFDAAGRLYVAINNALGVPDAVLIFSQPLSGNKAPSNILCGPNTGVNNPTGIAVNAQGTLFVVNSAFGGSPGYEATFAGNNIGGGVGCAGPFPNGAVSGPNTTLINPTGIALH
ncbi:MAG: NHL repeat-containing protein [Candidatus Eremiobacteraeota bacterium]|nr:NHL repeat-containing protein [Candidatus Eremiobacteraeota bacterium]